MKTNKVLVREPELTSHPWNLEQPGSFCVRTVGDIVFTTPFGSFDSYRTRERLYVTTVTEQKIAPDSTSFLRQMLCTGLRAVLGDRYRFEQLPAGKETSQHQAAVVAFRRHNFVAT